VGELMRIDYFLNEMLAKMDDCILKLEIGAIDKKS
jgi:hypothetical protein